MHANNSQLLLRHISCSDVTILQSSTQYLNQAEEDNIAFQLSYFPTSPPEVADAAPCESMFTRRSVVRVSSDPESFINNNGRIEFNPEVPSMVRPVDPSIGVTVPGCACDIIITRTNVVVSKVPLPSNKRGNMFPRAPAPPAPPIPPIIIIRRRSLVSLRESFKIRGRSMFMSRPPAPPAAPPSPPLRRRIINKESLPLRMEEFVRRRSGRIPPRPPVAPPVPPRPPLPRREKRRRSFVEFKPPPSPSPSNKIGRSALRSPPAAPVAPPAPPSAPPLAIIIRRRSLISVVLSSRRRMSGRIPLIPAPAPMPDAPMDPIKRIGRRLVNEVLLSSRSRRRMSGLLMISSPPVAPAPAPRPPERRRIGRRSVIELLSFNKVNNKRGDERRSVDPPNPPEFIRVMIKRRSEDPLLSSSRRVMRRRGFERRSPPIPVPP